MGRLIGSMALAGLLALPLLVSPPLLTAIGVEDEAAHQEFQEFAFQHGRLLDRIRAARSKEEADTLKAARKQLLKEWNEAFRRSRR